jgi:N-acetylneuraminic acid mutarotase
MQPRVFIPLVDFNNLAELRKTCPAVSKAQKKSRIRRTLIVCLFGSMALGLTLVTASAQWATSPANLPDTLIRAAGVDVNGNFYVIGGRTSDTAGSDFQHILVFDSNSGSWTEPAPTLPDNQTNNMACASLTVGNNSVIYCVGGSAAGQSTATARVFSYDPNVMLNPIQTLSSADNWPGDPSGTILPGGFAVANNKLYILGGFNINVSSTNQIWEFNPAGAVGSKWTQEVHAPEGIAFASATTINGVIYVAGASDFSGGILLDTAHSFSFNPTSNTIGSIAPIPRATGETRAVTLANRMWVLGGGRVTPNPGNEVDVYDPGTNSWLLAPSFAIARRNFPAASDGNHIWIAGGYASDGSPLSSLEIYTPPPLQITSVTHLDNGHIALQGTGVVGAVHTIQASADVNASNFSALARVTATAGGVITYDDAGAVGLTKRFYRLTFP